jgi:hypothetical protein
MADLQGGRKALNEVQAPAEAKAGGQDESECAALRMRMQCLHTLCVPCTTTFCF